MFELIYRSVADNNISTEDILNILKTSREFNSKNDITGCLLYYNYEFIQILEGEKDIIQELYAKIEKDKRHNNVILLAEDEKETRAFKSWNMAFHELDNNDVTNLNNLLFVSNFVTIADLTEKPTHAIKIFWYIAKLMLQDEDPPSK